MYSQNHVTVLLAMSSPGACAVPLYGKNVINIIDNRLISVWFCSLFKLSETGLIAARLPQENQHMHPHHFSVQQMVYES